MLKLYCNSISEFKQHFDSVREDFLENLTLGMKLEPQSLQWVKQ